MLAAATVASAAEVPDVRAQFRWASTAVKFDVSPPLRDMPALPPPEILDRDWFGVMMVDPDPDKRWYYTPNDDVDGSVQGWSGPPVRIPTPTVAFNAGTGGSNPPDPVGDIGPNHYVRMANASFQIFNRTGTSLFGPAAINSLWQGFGGDCEFENFGDPIVVYDQLADRWLLSQFSNTTGPGFFNCVALSTTSDPTGTYFRYAFPSSAFPDYPKYGIWSNAYVITTRETGISSIGTYAINRQQMLAGNPTPTVISFLQPLDEDAEFVGDGLLPADIDGSTLPPPGSPVYLVGAMDDGGPYGAEQDALSLWRLTLDFTNPPASTMVLASVIPIAPYDTIYPCNGRSCIAQPNGQLVDILSYRQRPTNRAAYRNFGSYESIVTTQSVEAAPNMAGMRWWEIRNPGGANPLLYQDSTYAPGVTDGVQRWMGSIAQDRNGNMGLGYSATSSTVFPSVRYTGRLESDPVNTMPQGEGELIAGTGSFQNGSERRWGDYTSMNIDSTDDCTFWYINEYFATTGATWTLRVGSFRFPTCGQPDFGIGAVPLRQTICAPAPAVVRLEAHAYSGFTGGATLGVTAPAGTIPVYAPPAIPLVPGASTLTVSNTGALAAGTYPITLTADSGSPGGLRSRTVSFDLFTAVPAAAGPTSPADDATSTSMAPLLTWTAATQGVSYVAEVATDAGFANIIFTSPASTELSARVPAGLLAFDTEYFWRVRATNICGTGANSAVSSFRTRLAPGVCPAGQVPLARFFDNMENGVNGWTTDPVAGTTWTQVTARPFSGLRSWLAVDVEVSSDQRLISPPIFLPANLGPWTLRFQHDVTIEQNTATTCWDGGFLEVSTNNGATWTPLPAGDVIQDAYTGPIPNGQPSWCGTRPYRTASADLQPFSGQSIRLRFRELTDTNTGSEPHGWYVDDVSVEACGTSASNALFSNGFE